MAENTSNEHKMAALEWEQKKAERNLAAAKGEEDKPKEEEPTIGFTQQLDKVISAGVVDLLAASSEEGGDRREKRRKITALKEKFTKDLVSVLQNIGQELLGHDTAENGLEDKIWSFMNEIIDHEGDANEIFGFGDGFVKINIAVRPGQDMKVTLIDTTDKHNSNSAYNKKWDSIK
jgi:hypothetical protein